MAETGAPGIPPAALIAMLLAEPPADFLGLALRWVPADQIVACRIAALACALRKAPLDPAGRQPEDDPGGKLLTEFEEWLRPGKGGSTPEQTALRIFCLCFACQLTPAAPDADAPDAAHTASRRLVIMAADWLLRWCETGKQHRPFGTWRLR